MSQADDPAVTVPVDTVARAGTSPETQLMDPCTALLGCIYTANQNGNDWLVPKCYEVLGPACAATLEQ